MAPIREIGLRETWSRRRLHGGVRNEGWNIGKAVNAIAQTPCFIRFPGSSGVIKPLITRIAHSIDLIFGTWPKPDIRMKFLNRINSLVTSHHIYQDLNQQKWPSTFQQHQGLAPQWSNVSADHQNCRSQVEEEVGYLEEGQESQIHPTHQNQCYDESRVRYCCIPVIEGLTQYRNQSDRIALVYC